MFENVRPFLAAWNAKYNERQKLQHVYLAVIVAGTVLAGLASLVKPQLGHRLMFVVTVAVIAFVVNATTWHLLHSAVLLNVHTPSVKPRRRS